MDDHGRAAVSGRVVDPGLDVAGILLGCPACLVEWIGDAVLPDDAVRRAGERMAFLGPGRSVDAHEAEALGVIARVGVMDVEIDICTAGVCSRAGYCGHRWRLAGDGEVIAFDPDRADVNRRERVRQDLELDWVG